jgi:hypothetical protein
MEKPLREQIRSWYAYWNVDTMPGRVEDNLLALIDSQILQARVHELKALKDSEIANSSLKKMQIRINGRIETLTKQQEGK